MATLQTGNSSLRVMPQLQQIDPRYFEGVPAAAFGAYRGGILTALDQAQLDEQQRRGEIQRMIQPQQIELAQVQVGDQLANIRMNPARRQVEQIGLDRSVELAPYVMQADKSRALTASSFPLDSQLYEDGEGNLVREVKQGVDDPSTGYREQSRYETVKTKADLDAEKLNAKSIQDSRVALNEQRAANADYQRERATNEVLRTKLAIKQAEKKAMLTKKAFTFKQRPIYDQRTGVSNGYDLTTFDPNTNKFVTYRTETVQEERPAVDAAGKPITNWLGRAQTERVMVNKPPYKVGESEEPPEDAQLDEANTPIIGLPTDALPSESGSSPAAQVAIPPVTVAPVVASPTAGIIQIQTDADYFALPSGATFLDPTGQRRVKP